MDRQYTYSPFGDNGKLKPGIYNAFQEVAVIAPFNLESGTINVGRHRFTLIITATLRNLLEAEEDWLEQQKYAVRVRCSFQMWDDEKVCIPKADEAEIISNPFLYIEDLEQ